MRISTPKLDRFKAKEVILYMLNKCPDLDEEALRQMLYVIDFGYYERHEEHLMGFTYRKD